MTRRTHLGIVSAAMVAAHRGLRVAGRLGRYIAVARDMNHAQNTQSIDRISNAMR